MNLKRQIGVALLALTLAPAYVAAQEKELNATVVSKEEKEIKVKTKDGEKTLLIGTKTKGLENAKEGSKVTIKYTEKDGQWSQRNQSAIIAADFDQKSGVTV